MTRDLRRWQAEALPIAIAAIAEGKAAVVDATTGAGKSVFIAELIRRYRENTPGLIVVTTPSVNLVEQLAATIASWLGPGIVGKYYTKAKQWRRSVLIVCNASVVALATVLAEQRIPVELWIADEVHKTETDQFSPTPTAEGETPTADLDRLAARRRIGLTATPFRASDSDTISLFTEEIYRYSPADALRDGVIVPWRFVRWGGAEAKCDDVIPEMIKALGDRATRGPGTVNASSIADADAYVATLATHGIAALSLHSRQSEATRLEAVAQLKNGEIDCIVHVAMLVEGVDFPWLRWGAFRRDVGSRVRFIQELGRYLRSNPGKTEAVILDPNGLEDRFAVTYDAALGWVEPKVKLNDEDETAPLKPQDKRTPKALMDKRTPKALMTARVARVSKYVREIAQGMIADGIIDGSKPRPRGEWRQADRTEAQANALGFLRGFAKRIEPDHAAALLRCVAWGGASRGFASDLIDVLGALKARPSRSVWSPPMPIAPPPEHAFDWIEPVTIAYAEAERYDERRCLPPVIALAAVGPGVSHAAARIATELDSPASCVVKYATWVLTQWPDVRLTVPSQLAADRLAARGIEADVLTPYSTHVAMIAARTALLGVRS